MGPFEKSDAMSSEIDIRTPKGHWHWHGLGQGWKQGLVTVVAWIIAVAAVVGIVCFIVPALVTFGVAMVPLVLILVAVVALMVFCSPTFKTRIRRRRRRVR